MVYGIGSGAHVEFYTRIRDGFWPWVNTTSRFISLFLGPKRYSCAFLSNSGLVISPTKHWNVDH